MDEIRSSMISKDYIEEDAENRGRGKFLWDEIYQYLYCKNKELLFKKCA